MKMKCFLCICHMWSEINGCLLAPRWRSERDCRELTKEHCTLIARIPKRTVDFLRVRYSVARPTDDSVRRFVPRCVRGFVKLRLYAMVDNLGMMSHHEYVVTLGDHLKARVKDCG